MTAHSHLIDAPALSGMAQLTDYAEIDEVLRSRIFVQGAYSGSRDNLMRDTLTLLDGEAHLQRRRLLGRLFSTEAMLAYRHQYLTPVIERTLAELARLERGADGAVHANLVPLVQRCLYRVGAAITGIDGLESPERADRFIELVRSIASGCTVDWSREDPTEVLRRAFEARDELERTLFRPSCERRRELLAAAQRGDSAGAVPNDIITLMLSHWEPSWDDELPLREVSVFLVGSTQTTAGALVLLMLRLEDWFARHPEQRALLASDPDFLRRAAFESLRMTVAAPARIRTATEDVTLSSGRRIAAGERVALLFLPANQDPSRFGEDAAEFNPWRETRDVKAWGHAFGGGAHACLGRPMVTGIRADEDTEGTLEAISRMLYDAGMELDGSDLAVPDDGTWYSTYVSVPVRFTAV
jgi:cytochrome P450